MCNYHVLSIWPRQLPSSLPGDPKPPDWTWYGHHHRSSLRNCFQDLEAWGKLWVLLSCRDNTNVLARHYGIANIHRQLLGCSFGRYLRSWLVRQQLQKIQERKRKFIILTSKYARWHLKSPASRLFTQPFIQAQIKENIKASRHWPLWEEFTGDRWIPRTKGQ